MSSIFTNEYQGSLGPPDPLFHKLDRCPRLACYSRVERMFISFRIHASRVVACLMWVRLVSSLMKSRIILV